jgi:hypothetical protein
LGVAFEIVDCPTKGTSEMDAEENRRLYQTQGEELGAVRRKTLHFGAVNPRGAFQSTDPQPSGDQCFFAFVELAL